MKPPLKALFFLASVFVALIASIAYSQVSEHVQPRFDHTIIFGDSLSDIGNMPMSPTLIEPSTKQIALNLYVPISNPIIPNKDLYRVPLTNLSFPYPPASPMASPPLNIGQKSYARKYKSLNWTQFFTNLAQHNHLIINPHTIVPWVWWMTHQQVITSINFAFSGATSDNVCRNFEYQHSNAQCDTDSIYKAQLPYRHLGFTYTQKNKSINLVQVPGLLKQISLFTLSAKKHPKLATKDTLYIIFIGGNDLNLDLLNLTQHHPVKAIFNLLGGTAYHIHRAIKTLIRQDHAQHIVIMNLFDMRLTPYLQTNLIRFYKVSPTKKRRTLALSKFSINLYNNQLRHTVRNANFLYNTLLHKHVTISYFDTYHYINQLAASKPFASPTTRYQMCLKGVGQPNTYYTKQNFCTHKQYKYLFWNGAHPSMYMGEYISYQLFQFLQTL